MVSASRVTSGDALAEDFALEPAFAPGQDSDEGEVDDTAILRALDASSDVDNAEDDDGMSREEPPLAKKRKVETDKKQRTKAAKRARVEFDQDEGAKLGLLPPESLADRLAEKQKRALPKMSSLEASDMRITESMILDTTHVVDRSTLSGFFRSAVATLPSTLSKPPKKPGSPRVIVIAGAALRVADLCREVKPFKTKDIDVAKLFAKHFKLSEHVEYLKQTKVGIAVGTPNRIGKLLEETDALLLTHLSYIVLDVTHQNSKKQSLLDMADCREDLFKLVLGSQGMMERLRDGRTKIAFF